MRVMFSILFILFLLSCSSADEMEKGSNQNEKYVINIEFEQVDGLTTGAKVNCKGVNIGEVSDIEITDGGLKVNVELEVDSNFKISKGSEFWIYSDITGMRAIDVVLKDSDTYYSSNDKVIGKNRKSISERVDVEINKLLEGNYNNKYFEILEDNDSFTIVKYNKMNTDTL